MWRNLAQLTRYRGLIQSLVARELKARYRGSALGAFWSFGNPLLLLLVYSAVFKYFVPNRAAVQPYALFLFCGLLPWTWFASSLNESANVLVAGGNLIKKVLFPAEVLPIVSVLANMVVLGAAAGLFKFSPELVKQAGQLAVKMFRASAQPAQPQVAAPAAPVAPVPPVAAPAAPVAAPPGV